MILFLYQNRGISANERFRVMVQGSALGLLFLFMTFMAFMVKLQFFQATVNELSMEGMTIIQNF
jgi:putative effector of murein hydrolase LrgA (UPF0299 family)